MGKCTSWRSAWVRTWRIQPPAKHSTHALRLACTGFCVFMGNLRDRSKTLRIPRMDDKSALLNQLRIDRAGESTPSRTRAIVLATAGIMVVAAGIAFWWWTRPVALPVHVVTAQAIA